MIAFCYDFFQFYDVHFDFSVFSNDKDYKSICY